MGHRLPHPHLTDADRHRLQVAGKEYGAWLAAHPDFWDLNSRANHADNVNEAAERANDSG
jgi:hypothetical protein